MKRRKSLLAAVLSAALVLSFAVAPGMSMVAVEADETEEAEIEMVAEITEEENPNVVDAEETGNLEGKIGEAGGTAVGDDTTAEAEAAGEEDAEAEAGMEDAEAEAEAGMEDAEAEVEAGTEDAEAEVKTGTEDAEAEVSESDEAEVEVSEEESEDAGIALFSVEGEIETLANVLPDAVDGTITLDDDVELNEIWEVDGSITLDLAGKTLTDAEEPTGSFTFSDDTSIGAALIYVPSGSSLTIMDSIGSGEVTTSDETYCIAAEGGTVTIEGGTFTDSQASDRTIWIREGSTLVVDGGTIKATGSGGRGINALDSTVTINGGTIDCEGESGCAVRVSGSELTVNGGTFTSVGDGIYISYSTGDSGEIGYSNATINGGSITVTGSSGTALTVAHGCNVTVEDVTMDSTYFGISYYGSTDYEETVLTINGGTYEAAQIGTSGYHYSNVHLMVNGGTFYATGTASEETPAGGFYFPCTGTLDFNDGTLISESDGIVIRDGTLNVTGGVIEANGVPEEWPDPDEQVSDNSGGYNGVGILVGQHTVDSYSDRYLTINISGGEIYGYAYALLENDYSKYNDHAYEDRIHVNISGGIFSSSGALDEHPVDIIDEDREHSEAALDEAHITGGFFSNHVEESDYIDDGYMCIEGVSTTGASGKEYSDYHAVIPDQITDSNTTFEMDQDTFTYNGSSQVPVVSNVVIQGAVDQVTLVEDMHYTVSYALNGEEKEEADVVNVNDYDVVVTGTGYEAECSFDASHAEPTRIQPFAEVNEDHTKTDSLDGSATETFSIVKAGQDISYAQGSVSKTTSDSPFTNELTETLVYGEITYTSSDTSVATVDPATGEVTIVGVGTTTITATAAGSENYDEATASYTLTVTTNDEDGDSGHAVGSGGTGTTNTTGESDTETVTADTTGESGIETDTAGTTSTTAAKTADTNAPILYGFLIALAGAALVTLSVRRRVIRR